MDILQKLKEVKEDSTSTASVRLQNLLNEAERLSLPPAPPTMTTSTTTTALQFCTKVSQAIDVIGRSMLLYPPRHPATTTSTTATTTEKKRQRIGLSFNGGKDCTVVLHLLLAALEDAKSSTTTTPPKKTTLLDCILPFYFSTQDVFAEELDFVQRTAETFFNGKANLLTMADVRNEDGVTTLVENYGIKAFLMGTRSTDPDGRWLNGVFWPSSKGWCPFMRINPCLDWSYHEVWVFLRFFNIEYCTLYDVGFTSIGSKSTSFPNPMLKQAKAKGKGEETAANDEYHPAYLLPDGAQERAGRIKSTKK